jgi:hypothetical protein
MACYGVDGPALLGVNSATASAAPPNPSDVPADETNL